MDSMRREALIDSKYVKNPNSICADCNKPINGIERGARCNGLPGAPCNRPVHRSHQMFNPGYLCPFCRDLKNRQMQYGASPALSVAPLTTDAPPIDPQAQPFLQAATAANGMKDGNTRKAAIDALFFDLMGND